MARVPDWNIESRSKPVICLITPLLRSLSTADRSLPEPPLVWILHKTAQEGKLVTN